MAKMISKFHVLIQSKLLWIGFIAVVVVSFILLPVAANMSNRSSARENAPGMLNGKPVPREEYEGARTRTYLSLMIMSLMQGQNFQYTDEVREYVNDVAWKRLITLRKARAMGFEAFDSEVADYIKSFPLFSAKGEFDPEIYALFKERFLQVRGFSVADFEQYASEEVLIQKTRQMVADMALVPPARIDSTLDMITSNFKLEYLVLNRASVTNDVKVTEEDARAAYERHNSNFTKPVSIDLKYVYFPYQEFNKGIDEPSQESLQEYYNNNISNYSISETNTVAESKDDDSTPSSYKPFEEVKADIAEELKQKQRAAKALDAANAMVFELPPDRNGHARSFADVASDMGVEVKDLAPFSIGDMPALDDSPEMVANEGNKLRPNPDEYFSDALPAESGVYILELKKRKPEFVPPFEEVKDEAIALAREINTEKDLDKKIVELRDLIKKDLDAGKSFAEAASKVGLKVETTEEFSAQTAADALSYKINRQALSEQIIFMNAGELTDPVFVGDGRLLAYVASRGPGDQSSKGSMRDMLYRSLSGDVVSKLYDKWQQNLLDEAEFKNLRDNNATDKS